MVGAYSILTAGMTMVGRVGLGVHQSMNVRYIGYRRILSFPIFLLPLITDTLVSEAKFPGHAGLPRLRPRWRFCFYFGSR